MELDVHQKISPGWIDLFFVPRTPYRCMKQKIMKILVIHHTDLDGAGAASVCGLYHQGEDITYKLYNYGFPLAPNELQGYDLIYAVDVSFGDHPWVYDIPGLIWIDHHKTSLDYEALHLGSKNIPGLRAIGKGACELTWEYLFPDYQCPGLIQILSTYDVWDKRRMDWTYVNEVEMGAKHILGVNPKSIIKFIKENRNPEELRNVGRVILGYLEKSGKGKMMSGFWIPDFHGHRCIALNTADFSSLSFLSHYNPQISDICMPFQVVPREGEPGEFYVRCSLYTENPYVDVSEIAKSYSGGGHHGSAGFQIPLETLQEILSRGMSLKEFFKRIGYKGNEPTYY